jgi:hypothetical protein
LRQKTDLGTCFLKAIEVISFNCLGHEEKIKFS